MRAKGRLITLIWAILLIAALAVPGAVYAEPDFPQVATVNGGNENSDTTSHTVNLPAGIKDDDLLLVFFAADGNPTITFPTGWIQSFVTQRDNEVKFGAWWRIADGSEGSTISVNTSASERSAHTSYRITGYLMPISGIVTTGNSTNPNPYDLDPYWEATDTLWLAACGYDDGRETVDAYPTNYSNGRNDRSSSEYGCGVGTARRELNADSENPGSFNLSAREEWVSATLAIRHNPFVLAPDTDTNPVGSDHTVTATIPGDTGGTEVFFDVTAGPNAGDTGTDSTNSSGVATWTYTGDGGTGTDTIIAIYTDNTLHEQFLSNKVTKTWVPACSLNVISDGCCPIDVVWDSGSGNVSANAAGTFTIPCCNNVTLTANNTTCCDFVNWTGNVTGAPNSTNPITFHMDGAKNITAYCHLLSYNLTVESDGCCPITVEWDANSEQVEAGGNETFTIPCCTDVTLTATETPCCELVYWTGDVPVGTNSSNPITLHMDGAKNVTGDCFATCVPGSIGDTVFYDNNNNRTQDPGEGGIAGVKVELYKDDGNGIFNPTGGTDEFIDTRTTGGNGAYLFADLEPFCDKGYWALVLENTLPPGVTLTTGKNPIGPICLEGGEPYEGADFGYLPLVEPPPPVGGEAYPVNKLAILAPWIAVAVFLAGGISCYVLRRRRVQS